MKKQTTTAFLSILQRFAFAVAAILPALLLSAGAAEPLAAWHARECPTTGSLMGVAAGHDQFVAAVFNTNMVLHSSDGERWVIETLPQGQRLKGVCFTNGRFVVWTFGKDLFLCESPKSSEWKAVTANEMMGSFIETVAYEDGHYLIGCGGKKSLWWSSDLAELSPVAGLPTGTLHGLAYAQGQWVGVMDSGNIIRSTQISVWRAMSLQQTDRANLWGIAYGNSEFVAVTDRGDIWRSSDAEHWVTAVHPPATGFFGIGFGAGRFVICGRSGLIQTSTDARNWNKCETPTQKNLRRLAFGKGTWVAVGDQGTILQSDPLP